MAAARPCRIVIAGSRVITDFSLLLAAIDQATREGFIKPAYSYEIISGGSIGVDTLARKYAHQFGYPMREFKPERQYGKGGPHRRNTQMAQAGDILIAVWNGTSPGTRHMIGEMEKLKKPVFKYIVAPKS